jgi:hypothetical protein
MTPILIPLIVLALASPGYSHQQGTPKPLQRLSTREPSIVWDSLAVRSDFDADGAMDYAFVGRARGRIFVGVTMGRADKIEIISFAIAPALQNAVCAEPASLTPERLESPDAEVGPLEGFRGSRRLRGLRLSGGECDAIHIYWNHRRHHLSWWRR